MNSRFLALTLGALFAAGAALAVPIAQDQAPAQGQQAPEHGRRRMDPDKQLAGMTKRLNLTADQQNQIRPILTDRQQQMQALWSNQSISREDRMAKMKTIREDSRAKIEAVLNSDQKQKFEEMHQQHRQQNSGNR